jgi:RNA polymerase sigma-70 factor (ECF subfamily)
VVGRPLDETELVERAKRGDEHAYGELMHAYQGIAFRIAYLVVGNAAEAEDAAQDGFVKAYRALHRFRSGEPLRPWLLKIVANEARNRRRASTRRDALTLRATAESSSGEAAPSPEAALLEREQRQALVAAVDALPEPQRLVIACRYFLELSEDETAEVLGIRRGTVKSRTARALDRLRETYG